MSKLDLIPARALDLASQAGDTLRDLAPRANDWLATGAKLGALKSGAKIGLTVVRRNPVLFAAAAAGAGLIWYATKRRAQRAENEGTTVDSTSRRIEARRGSKQASASDDSGEANTRTRRTASRARSGGASRNRSTREPRTQH